MTLKREGVAALIYALAFAVVWAFVPMRTVAPLHAQPQAGVGVAYNRCIAVTTSDTVDLSPWTQQKLLTGMVYVGTSAPGNVVAVAPDGSTVTFTAPPVGAQLPIAVRRINATGTTAAALVACYKV